MDTRFPLILTAWGLLLAATMACGQEAIHARRPTVRPGNFEELLQVDPRGGMVLTFPDFDLTKPDAKWQVNGLEMVYEPVEGTSHGCYRMVIKDPGAYLVGLSQSSLTLKPNRAYVLSALLYCNFSRKAGVSEDSTEINLGTFTYGPLSSQPGASPDRASLGQWNGLPEQTHGWVRWEWEFPAYLLGGTTFFWFRPFAPGQADFRLADVKLIELPPQPLVPFGKGEGVTFRGGPGQLPLRIGRVASAGDRLTVETTGARYTFEGATATLRAEQLLEKPRRVAQWEFSVGLEGLEVLRQSDTECVLANDRLTFGVQCDGMVMVSPQEETAVTLTSDLGGRWNRLIAGHLLVVDDFGGFTVNPALPLGSGRLARTEVLTPHLDFLGKLNDTTFLSSADPGWQVRWSLSPGERLALSVFPPRPFDWEKSFRSRIMLTFEGLPTTVYQDHYRPAWFDIPILWDFTVRGYGMSWGPQAVPAHEGRLRAHLDAIRAAGLRPIPYFSAYFYYSRDPLEWVDELARWQREYGIRGVYSDGLPDQEWLVAYEEMRLARELFPDGDLIVHTTGQSFNGGPPLALADLFMPFIDTYATATVRGEWILARGRDWPYPRYVSSQFRKANCIGIQKGDRWEDVPQSVQDALNLLYNGRAWYTSGPYDPPVLKEWTEGYLPKLQILRELWEEKGSEADFYERYYLPKAQELTGLSRP